MPASAIASGAVDHVLPVDEIARRIVGLEELLDRAGAPPDETSLAKILARVRGATGHDFAAYRKGTLTRRIERRRRALALKDDASYASHIMRDAEEPYLLFRDLLVGVTSFFRTPDAFEVLAEKVLPEIVRRNAEHGAPTRVWAAGCSTGQEAYSLAMTLVEIAQTQGDATQVQIFATDIDPVALETARRGLYPASIAADVSPERLRRFFVREGECFRVTNSLREKVIFSLHNVTKDPPFSRLDLLVCRNLLIYLEPALQRRLFPFFHYALRPGGHLFLGASESVGEFGDLFETVDKKHKIYRRQPAMTRDLEFPAAMARGRSSGATVPSEGTPSLAERARAALLARHTPTTAVVNERGDLLYVHGRTAPFLELPEGEPSLNLFRMIRPDLRPDLRAALHRARNDGEAVSLRDVPRIDDPEKTVDLVVEPLDPDQPHGLTLVLFRGGRRVKANAASPSAPLEDMYSLEVEIRTLRDALQTTVEDLESTNEELTSSNEELLSMNEELQSANEELETSKEEVQSVNEELASVNSELHEKIAELTRTNNDITNLLASTRVATLFLDTQLRIARYTPDVTAIYRLNPSDIGRPIADLTSSLAYPELVSDAAVVLERLGTIERHVRNEHGGHYLVRLMPYRTLDLRVEGVVATFVDVSNLERAREELSVALGLVEDYKEALDASTQVLILGAEGEAVDANERFLELVGRPKVDVIGRLRLLDPRWEPAQGVARAWEALPRGEVWRGVLPLATARDELTVEATIVPVAPGKDGSRRYLAIVLDITERVRAAEALRESEVRFRALFEQAATGIALVDREERVVTSNQALGVMLGYAPAELAGTPLTRYAHPEDRALDHELRREVLAAARAQYEIEKRYIARDGSSIIVRESVSSIRHAPGGAQHLVVIMQDVTQVRRAEEALRSQTSLAYLGEMSAVVAHEVRNALSGIRAAVDVVGGGLPEGSMERRAVEEVRARIGSLNDTVEDLLRFSRPRRPRIAEVSIRRVLEEVARSLSATGQRASLDVQGEDVVLEGDDQLLGSAFLNLCLNAAQALDGDGTIVVSTRAEQRSVIVDIVDHGSGIPPHLREEIFEPFFTTRSRGTGLGLPIARRVVEAHGGTIEIGDVEGGGTRVTVRLPIAQGLSASK